jgi:hypothetical protein
MKRSGVSVLVAALFALAAFIPSVAIAKSCSSSYTHAVIGGQQKCLRRGEFCAHRYASQYRHYHFSCSYYVSGEYHLEPVR